MRPVILALILVLLFALPAQAEEKHTKHEVEPQSTIFERVEGFSGRHPGFGLDLELPELGLRVYNYPVDTDFEIGHFWPVYHKGGTTLAFGTFFAHLAEHHYSYLLPTLAVHHHHKRARFSLEVADYAPVNKGPNIIYMDELYVGYKLTRHLETGLAGTMWAEAHEEAELGFGPSFRYFTGKYNEIDASYFVGVKGPDGFRVQYKTRF